MTFLDIISVVMSVIALSLSLYSVYVAKRSHDDRIRSNIVAQQFSVFDQLGKLRLENCELSHVFELPENYLDMCALCAKAITGQNSTAKSQMLLRERAVVMQIFQAYENAYYQWINAKEIKDKPRQLFLGEVLAYFTGRLLRNPRLLYYWAPAGGRLCNFFELQTTAHYKKHVLEKLELDIAAIQDEKGPF